MKAQPAYQAMIQTSTSQKELAFAQSLKISEELWELNEQLLGKFWLQRKEKADRFSDEKLAFELADIVLSVGLLAKELDMDLDQALEKKTNLLRKRFL